jgi:hypothetical protein
MQMFMMNLQLWTDIAAAAACHPGAVFSGAGSPGALRDCAPFPVVGFGYRLLLRLWVIKEPYLAMLACQVST